MALKMRLVIINWQWHSDQWAICSPVCFTCSIYGIYLIVFIIHRFCDFFFLPTPMPSCGSFVYTLDCCGRYFAGVRSPFQEVRVCMCACKQPQHTPSPKAHTPKHTHNMPVYATPTQDIAICLSSGAIPVTEKHGSKIFLLMHFAW